MSTPTIQQYGAKPAFIQWTVVRGDTATLEVQFYAADESTYWDTTGWEYEATVYDPRGDVLDCLNVVANEGYAYITAPASVTRNWGLRYDDVVAELKFDLQVKIPAEGEDTIWTPVIGTVCVIGDITPGGSI
jgi:hypothetical protein